MNKKCIICKNDKLEIINIKKPFLTHLDFEHFESRKKNNLLFCKNCSHVFRSDTLNNKFKFFKSKKYNLHKEDHKYFYKNKTIEQKKLQAKIIIKNLKKKNNLNILDYGCFDGTLLRELSKYNNIKELIGYDVSKRKMVNSNILFFTDLKKIKTKIDLVIFSNSIIYEKNINKKLKILNNIIHDDTKFYIQIPDYANRAILFSLIDQIHFFSKYSIKSLFLSHNVNLKEFKFPQIKNDLIFFGSRKKNILKKNCSKNEFKFKKIEKKIKKLSNFLSEIENKKIYIFGSTIYASYFSHYCKKFIGFIDEDPEKIGKSFLNKKIYFIDELKNKNACCLVFDDNDQLKNKLKKSYSYKIKCI